MAIESAAGAPITGISSMATRHVLAELGDAYERATGQRVDDRVGRRRRRRAARATTAKRSTSSCWRRDAIDALAAAGRVDPDSRVDLARSGVAIAVAAGAPRPDIGSEAAVRDAVLRRAQHRLFDGPERRASRAPARALGHRRRRSRRASCRRRPAFRSARSSRAATSTSASSN